MLRIVLQQGFISKKTLRQPFRIVQPFNGKDILDAFELALQLRQLRRQRPFSTARNLFRIDTDRIDFGLERFSPGHMLFAVARRQAGLHRYAIQKRQSVAFGLETQ